MVMTFDQDTAAFADRKTGDGLVMVVDRTREFRRASRRTALVKLLRVACPAAALVLLAAYGLTIAQTAGFGSGTLSELAVRKILPEDLAMKNPRYEGFMEDGGSYVFTAKTANQELKTPNVIKLNAIVGEVYQADKTRTDITAKRGLFNHEKSILDLYDEILVVSESGLKATLTQATLLTKEDLLTSDKPVLVEFPNGSIRSKQMTLRQKAREATFVDTVAVKLTPPPEEKPAEAAPEPEKKADNQSLFTPSNGPIDIDANRLDLNDAAKTALFTGNVRARQAEQDMTTPELEVTYEGEGMMGAAVGSKPAAGTAAAPAGKIKRILAKNPVVMTRANGDVVTSESADFDALSETAILSGNVVMTSGEDRRAAGDRVEIDQVTGSVLLVGQVVVNQGGNELRGGRLEIDRTHGTAQLTTPPDAGSGPGRINARLIRDAGGKAASAITAQAEAKAPAEAEAAGALASFKTDPKAPIEVDSDSLDVNDRTKVALFRGDVHAVQGTFKITCAELHAFYKGEAGLMDAAVTGAAPSPDKKSTTELTRVEAKTDVKVTSKDGQTATGDWAEFDTKTNMITMGGNVVLSRGKNMVRGTRLLIDMTTGESKIDTAPQNTVANPAGGGWVTEQPAEPAGEKKGRASAVFFPQELKGDEGKGGSKKAKPAPTAEPAPDGWSATASPDDPGTPAN